MVICSVPVEHRKHNYRRVADPDPGWEKSGPGMNIPDNFSESLETVFRVKNTVLKFFDADDRKNSDPG